MNSNKMPGKTNTGLSLTCLVVDDEPVARNIIRNYCSHIPWLHIAGEYGNALDAKERLSTEKVDLLFLDIHMPVLNGVAFLSTLKNPPQVIFTTAYQEFAVDAFDLAACDYLLKPFSLDRFLVAVDKAREKIQQLQPVIAPGDPQMQQDYFFIRAEGKLYKVLYREFLYGEAQGNYTKIVTASTIILTKTPFSVIVSLLPDVLFTRVHRSFIINKAMISHIEGNRVFMGQKEIPVGAGYRNGLFKAIGLKLN